MNPTWLSFVALANRVDQDECSHSGVHITRIRGGGNNAIYRVTANDEDYAIKLCVADERRRAWREYHALKLMQQTELNIAADPVLLDESCTRFPHPIVVYRWLDGEPLGDTLSKEQLGALLSLVQQAHSIHPADNQVDKLLDAEYHNFDFNWYLDELQELFSKYGEWLATRPEERELYRRLKNLIESCIDFVSHVKVNPDRSRIALCFCHVDANLANVIWNSRREMYWVDWEYSGWGDPALELAEFESHLGAAALTATQRCWLRKNYRRPSFDPEFDDRLSIWDRILFTRWTLLMARALWSAYHGPDRVRLTMSIDKPEIIRARLVSTIERAEKFF